MSLATRFSRMVMSSTFAGSGDGVGEGDGAGVGVGLRVGAARERGSSPSEQAEATRRTVTTIAARRRMQGRIRTALRKLTSVATADWTRQTDWSLQRETDDMAKRAALPLAVMLILLTADVALGHAERPSQFPDGSGGVPRFRTSGPYLVVCQPSTLSRIANFPPALKAFNRRLYAKCLRNGFRNIQAAVDAVRVPGTRILIQPGVYREKPSLRPLSEECAQLADKEEPLSYEEQKRCPHVENLIGIFGDSTEDADIKCDGPLCNLQIQGTG
ncbi:MAG: hypothetical protein M3N24_03570, partial [Actinomycetota bacterium]|nr:hypothetical protein [Actinomycetota bacterium]